MQTTSLIPRLLSLLAIVGLLTAPMATPSSAAMSDASMAAMSDSATEAAAMPDGMPCCPDQKPVGPDCMKTCPVTFLCMAKCVPGTPTAAIATPARIAMADMKSRWDDVWRDLLPDPPPPEPPRA